MNNRLTPRLKFTFQYILSFVDVPEISKKSSLYLKFHKYNQLQSAPKIISMAKEKKIRTRVEKVEKKVDNIVREEMWSKVEIWVKTEEMIEIRLQKICLGA